ncbi:hypothetical protein P389DRAFT_86321 [Cystobasidium minutum MCA 4210]|uniref:uncharacterized protein n=1 Tax=Cystobasidium minutum MCA 4210 TaxID=1397322 RepID=UPI0034CD6A0A|eukprot:jgi/Rhomi1/86321/CE86320_15
MKIPICRRLSNLPFLLSWAIHQFNWGFITSPRPCSISDICCSTSCKYRSSSVLHVRLLHSAEECMEWTLNDSSTL